MRILIILGLIVILYYLVRGFLHPRRGEGNTRRKGSDMGQTGGSELVKDPYCQTYIPIKTALQAKIEGENLFFCSQECKNRYLHEKRSGSSRGG